MRIIKQLREELFVCRKRLRALVFDKNGAWKKGLDKRDQRAYLRIQYYLSRIMNNNGEGMYLEPSEAERFKISEDMKNENQSES